MVRIPMCATCPYFTSAASQKLKICYLKRVKYCAVASSHFMVLIGTGAEDIETRVAYLQLCNDFVPLLFTLY